MDPVVLNSISIFLVQIGSRFLTFNFTDAQKKVIQHPWGQSIILFAMFYVGTRNLLVSTCLILFYNLCLYFLLNEKSHYNIYNRRWLEKEGFQSEKVVSRTKSYSENITRLI